MVGFFIYLLLVCICFKFINEENKDLSNVLELQQIFSYKVILVRSKFNKLFGFLVLEV